MASGLGTAEDGEDSDGELCTCLAAGRVHRRAGEDRGDLRASTRAARAVGIGNTRPGLDNVSILRMSHTDTKMYILTV